MKLHLEFEYLIGTDQNRKWWWLCKFHYVLNDKATFFSISLSPSLLFFSRTVVLINIVNCVQFFSSFFVRRREKSKRSSIKKFDSPFVNDVVIIRTITFYTTNTRIVYTYICKRGKIGVSISARRAKEREKERETKKRL